MRSPEEEMYAGGWKCLCAGVLLQAVQRLAHCPKIHKAGSGYRASGKSGLYKEAVHQKMCAREWIQGGVGLITFEECCEAIGADPEWIRERVEECRDSMALS